MLYPVEFVGIPPLLGWQGVIPKNAEEMSQSFSVLIHDKLVDLEKIFANIDHDDNEEIDKVVEDVAQEIIREFSTNIAPDSWARAREKLASTSTCWSAATCAASRWRSSTAWPRRRATSSTSTPSCANR